MIKEMYMIRDILTDFKETILLFSNELEARRWFRGMCEDPNMKTVAKDMELYKIGIINLKDGHLETLEIPNYIERGETNA